MSVRGFIHKKQVSMVAFLTAIAMVTFGTVYAQENTGTLGNGFKISPVRQELTVEKGTQEQVELEIENPTGSDITGKVIINDFEANNENGEPKILYDPATSVPGNSFKSIATSSEKISIPAGGKVKLPVTISVPENGPAGGYYGAVRVEPSELDQGSNVAVGASVGTIFLVLVPGDITELLEIKDISTSDNGSNSRLFIGNGDNISIQTTLKNNGNVHVKPFGRIQIADRNGNVVEQFEFNNTEPRANVLPDSERKFTNELSYNKFFGKYTVTANLGYGSNGNLLTAKNTFWVIPIWLIVAFIASLLAILVGAFLIYKKVNSSRRHKVKPRR